jgi:hypothetical protein
MVAVGPDESVWDFLNPTCSLAATVPQPDGASVGTYVDVGSSEGINVEAFDGDGDGGSVGVRVGEGEGTHDGTSVGTRVGASVGMSVRLAVAGEGVPCAQSKTSSMMSCWIGMPGSGLNL